jgi:hypothetical protein
VNGCGWGRPDGSHGDSIGEAVWSLLKWAMASFAAPDLASLVRIVKRKLKKIQYRPHLVDGCLAKTGLTIEA